MKKDVIIVGGGIAGLSAGCYLQMNGYNTAIFEMHDKPGGLCTAWERKGYTIDGCLHWLVGSAPGNGFHRFWLELGMLQGGTIIDLDEFYRYEAPDGRQVIMYCNADQLEQHLKEVSPEDGEYITRMANGIRRLATIDMPIEKAPELQTFWNKAGTGLRLAPHLNALRTWTGLTVAQLAAGFKNQHIRDALKFMPGEFSAMGFMMTMAWLHKKVAGYPIGGSMPLIRAVEKRYQSLGGEIFYQAKVTSVAVDADHANGVTLADGTVHQGTTVVWAADGHTAAFDLFKGNYLDDTIRGYYREMPIFTPLIFAAFGARRTFNDVPKMVSGLIIGLEKPVSIGGRTQRNLHVRFSNFDSTMAPEGKTVLSVMMDSDYQYWKELRKRPEDYKKAKEDVAEAIIRILDRRFRGLKELIEMTDIATPVTFERYTGNWRGCYEGFMPTPKSQLLTMKKTLPGLSNFYMIGQWVSPGGGLPSGVMTGRHITQILCNRDGRRFTTSLPEREPVLQGAVK